MSGWLIARSLTGGPLDEERWRRSIDRIPANELSVDQAFSGKCAIAAWRREQGEFALSGRLTSPNPDGGKRVAWIGQCVNDAGDATPAANGRRRSVNRQAEGHLRFVPSKRNVHADITVEFHPSRQSRRPARKQRCDGRRVDQAAYFQRSDRLPSPSQSVSVKSSFTF